MNEKENFIFIASWASTIESFDEMGQSDIAGELAKQIIYYGVSGEITTQDPIISGIVSSMCAALIEKSKNRHRACIKNGKQGGSPKKYDEEDILYLRDKGFSDKEIADNLGCHVRTVQRILSKSDDEI
jgi:hypothetical protein